MSRAWDLLWVHGLGAWLAWLLRLPIRGYQLLVSPLLAPSCRYHPSCSRYASDALRTHGPFKGLILGSWRLLRCNPWSPGGLDPVPERGRWRPSIYPDGTARDTTTVVRPPQRGSHHEALGA